MNRRSFLAFLGIAPTVPIALKFAPVEPIEVSFVDLPIDASKFSFTTSGVERMRILCDGSVIIPEAKPIGEAA